MHGSLLRTGWLWLRIWLAHLRPPRHTAPFLVFAVVVLLAMNLAKMSAMIRQDVSPEPGPRVVPSSGPAPTPSVSGPAPSPTVSSAASTPSASTPAPTTSARVPRTATPTPGPDLASRGTFPPPALAPAPATPATFPPPTVETSAPPAPMSPPTYEPPSEPPARLALSLAAAPDSGDMLPCHRVPVTFTGTIEVDRAATVTYRWEPSDGSTGLLSKVFTAAGRKTVRTVRIVTGRPGTTIEGTVRLAASAPGAGPVTRTATYRFTCGGVGAA